jgi:hypothetical protein
MKFAAVTQEGVVAIERVTVINKYRVATPNTI